MRADYSDFIKKMPQADLPMPGITGYLLSGEAGQVVFFDLPAGTSVPPHSHGAQWGIVVDGEIELTISGVTKTYKPGDSYHIGDGEEHAAVFKTAAKIIDVVADNNRYTAK
jgi:quercetin dioxygenase-like cupin family protein